MENTVMAEEAAPEVTETLTEMAKGSDTVAETAKDSDAAQDMELEPHEGAEKSENGAESGKRVREEGEEQENEEDGGGAKKKKVEKSMEEERLEKSETAPAAPEKTGPVTVGTKTFGTSVEIFDYFFKLLHFWSPNININKYEHMMLLDLLKKGHLEPEKKIGKGIRAFQVRYHPQWKSRCYFLVREDGSCDDFSFRKCVDHILPLPESMQINSNVNKALGGGKRGGRGNWRGRGRGRGGKR